MISLYVYGCARQLIRYLQTKYENTQIVILFDKGDMSERDYEDKVEEAFRQMGIDVERI